MWKNSDKVHYSSLNFVNCIAETIEEWFFNQIVQNTVPVSPRQGDIGRKESKEKREKGIRSTRYPVWSGLFQPMTNCHGRGTIGM